MDNFRRNGKLDEHIYQIITKYWNSSGQELKNYRDLDVHHYAIIRHTFLQVSPEEKILVFLPDNPREEKRERATFKMERDALLYFKDQFYDFHSCVEEIAATLGYSKKRIGQVVTTSQLGEELKEGENKTLALMIQSMGRYDVVVDQNENRTLTITTIASNEATKHLDDGDTLFNQGKYDEAIKAYEKAIDV